MLVSGLKFVEAKWSYGVTEKFGIAVHCTANTASAAAEALYCTRRPDGTSCHFFIDEYEVIQVLDTKYRAGHAGSSQGNANAIALEFCGLISWTREQWLKNINFVKVGQTLAKVILAEWPDKSFKVERASVAQMKANPKVKEIYTHNDMRLAWGGTSHTDPGPNFPMDVLFDSILKALGGNSVEPGSRTLRLTSPFMTGDDVKVFQKEVGVTEDGVFGKATETAVKEWQKRVYLTPDGVVNAVDWAVSETRGQVLVKQPDDERIWLSFISQGARVRFHVKKLTDVTRWVRLGVPQVTVTDVSIYGTEIK